MPQPSIQSSQLQAEYRSLKRLRSALAHSQKNEDALRASRRMVEVATLIHAEERSPRTEKNLAYARYYEAVSSCLVAQFASDFILAKQSIDRAVEAARVFQDSPRFWPNFFFDEIGLRTYPLILQAMEAFRSQDFAASAVNFDQWKSLNARLKNRGDVNFDSNTFHDKLCMLLSAIQTGQRAEVEWLELEGLLASKRHNVSRTTRALWNHVLPLRRAAIAGVDSFPGGLAALRSFLDDASSAWALLSTSAPIAVEDRISQPRSPRALPDFLEPYPLLTNVGSHWQFALRQLLLNAVILKADYELQQAQNTDSPDASSIGRFELERLTPSALFDFIRTLLVHRKPDDLLMFEEAVSLWRESRRQISEEDQAAAVEAAELFFTKLKLPHVVQVNSCEEIYPQFGSDLPSSTRFRVRARRIWRQMPDSIELETSESLTKGQFAYLRGRWNISRKPHFRVRNPLDLPLATRIPEWMMLYRDWAESLGPVTSDVFLRWAEQIEPRWLPSALRLLGRVLYLDDSAVRGQWLNFYRSKLPAELKGKRTLFVGLGQAAKSGEHQLFYMKQALTALGDNERGFEFSTSFLNVESLSSKLEAADHVVFVDDFIGTGEQATKFVRETVERNTWLRDCSLWICALIGFENGIATLRTNLQDLGASILVNLCLSDADRAFSDESTIWD